MIPFVTLSNCFLSLLMILYNLKSNRNILFLSLMVLIVSSYTFAYHLLITGESRFWLAVFWGNLSPFWYLGGPALYFYVKGTLQDHFRLQKSDFPHLIPFLVALIGVFPYLLTSFEHKLQVADSIIQDLGHARDLKTNWILSVNANNILRPALVVAYSIAGILSIVRFESTVSHSSSIPRNQWKITRNWMLMLIFIILAINVPALILSSYYAFNPLVGRQEISSHFINEFVGYLHALIPVTLLIYPQVLYGIPRYQKSSGSVMDSDLDTISVLSEVEKSDTPFSPNYAKGEKPEPDPFQDLGEQILEVMREKKPYLHPDFSPDDLAQLLKVPKNHLYYCFRNILHTKFTRLRMDYRIEHARKRLEEADLRHITLESIGKDSGFSSKSGFYNTFKAEVGCAPGEYAQKHNHSYEASNFQNLL